MKVIFAILCLAAITFGCRPEGSHSAETRLINTTEVEINIVKYLQSKQADNVNIISPKQSTIVYANGGRGKGAGYSFASEIVSYDSVCVIFNRNDSVIHYRATTSGNNPNAIRSNDPRSLYSHDAYSRQILDENKNTIRNEYTYTFTEQDYLYAQK